MTACCLFAFSAAAAAAVGARVWTLICIVALSGETFTSPRPVTAICGMTSSGPLMSCECAVSGAYSVANSVSI